MGFHKVTLPASIKLQYDSAFNVGFGSAFTQTDAGGSYVNQSFEDPVHIFDLSSVLQTPAQANAMKEFWLQRRGGANTWLFEDPTDLSTLIAPQNPDDIRRGAPTSADIGYGPILDPTTNRYQQFQLKTVYEDVDNGFKYERAITKPQPGTVVGSTLNLLTPTEIPSGAIVVDENTGIVTIDTQAIPGAAAGHVLRLGCKFYVPVRFARQTDASLADEWEDYNNEQRSLLIVEEREDIYLDGLSEKGGVYVHENKSGDFVLDKAVKVHMVLSSTDGDIVLPDIDDSMPDGEYFAIINVNANSPTARTIKTTDGVALGADLAPGQMAQVILGTDGSGGRAWYSFRLVP